MVIRKREMAALLVALLMMLPLTGLATVADDLVEMVVAYDPDGADGVRVQMNGQRVDVEAVGVANVLITAAPAEVPEGWQSDMYRATGVNILAAGESSLTLGALNIGTIGAGGMSVISMGQGVQVRQMTMEGQAAVLAGQAETSMTRTAARTVTGEEEAAVAAAVADALAALDEPYDDGQTDRVSALAQVLLTLTYPDGYTDDRALADAAQATVTALRDAMTDLPQDTPAQREDALNQAFVTLSQPYRETEIEITLENIVATDGSVLVLGGGVNAQRIRMQDTSQLTGTTGVAVGWLMMEGQTEAELTGATVGKATLGGRAEVALHEGTVVADLYALDMSSVTVDEDAVVSRASAASGAEVDGLAEDQEVLEHGTGTPIQPEETETPDIVESSSQDDVELVAENGLAEELES